MIGIFDSGLGGVTVLRRVREALPQHDVVYFADQKHVPYGDRKETELLELLNSNLRTLAQHGAQLIVSACNTSCAVADKFGWPRSEVPVLDLIESAGIAVMESGAGRIGVVATTATARSGAYARHIVARVPDARVTEIAAPALVPFVEAGKIDDPRTRDAVAAACASLAPVDALVLGCTHYPLLMQHFVACAGGAQIIDPAIVHARRAAEAVARYNIPSGTGAVSFVTNGDAAAFERNVAHAMGYSLDTADVK